MAEAILDEANRAETFKDFLKKEEPFEAVVVGVDCTGLESKLGFSPFFGSKNSSVADEVFIEYKITSRKSFSVPTTDNGNTNVGSL